MKLPNFLFFTGVPGSHWSAIAQDLEKLPGINTSDHNEDRNYSPGHYTGHKGAYFGKSMELEAYLRSDYLSTAWQKIDGTKIVKSHDWALKLDSVKEHFPNDWIMLVYRPDLPSYAWWHEAGGFNIKYPSYAAYKDSATMLGEIAKQNQAMLKYAYQTNATWNHYSSQWVEDTFGTKIETKFHGNDILVTVIK
jgi:hypothetical protein